MLIAAMRFTSTTSADGVIEHDFSHNGVPGVLWAPAGATGPRPLILLGHGGGQHKKAPGMVGRARHFVAGGGFAVAALDAPGHGDHPRNPDIDLLSTEMRSLMAAGKPVAGLLATLHDLVAAQSVPEWRAALDALQNHDLIGKGPAGYCGVSMGAAVGIPFVAAEPRIHAAALGLAPMSPTLAAAAEQITIPVEFLLQWDDEHVPREEGLALFDALSSTVKTLHANPGRHADVPRFEVDSALRFFQRHLIS
jgi:pimeloyl-ACP methyl ester carboxylesterase